jgi:predicted nucleotidyltransferase
MEIKVVLGGERGPSILRNAAQASCGRIVLLMNVDEALKKIQSRLQATFPERLRGVLLYGSEARGGAREDSDLDLMVLLEGPLHLGKDLETIVESLYPVQLELDRVIHALPVTIEAFEAAEYGLYREAKRDGVLL